MAGIQDGFALKFAQPFDVYTPTETRLGVLSTAVPEIYFFSSLNESGLFYEGLDRVLDPGSTTFTPQGDDISIVPPSQWAPLQFNSLIDWAFQAGQYYGAAFDGYLNVPSGGDVTFDLLCGPFGDSYQSA